MGHFSKLYKRNDILLSSVMHPYSFWALLEAGDGGLPGPVYPGFDLEPSQTICAHEPWFGDRKGVSIGP